MAAQNDHKRGKGKRYADKHIRAYSGISSGVLGSGDLTHDELGGNCPACGEYDVELAADGHCRNEGCYAERVTKALLSGHARMLASGTLIWSTKPIFAEKPAKPARPTQKEIDAVLGNK